MRITDLISVNGVKLNVNPHSKEEALDILIDLHSTQRNITDKKEYKKDILAREDQGSTAIGEGLAIPHAKSPAVDRPGLSAITIPNGVDCNAFDNQPTKLMFMIAAPIDGDVHLEVLANLNIILMDGEFRNKLLHAKSSDDFIRIIDEKENERLGVESNNIASDNEKIVLAVTACPTGIAHTYMAAEALEQKGKEMGIFLKAETNGSGGAKNILTKEEIEKAEGIIIAADKNVEMARFNGKKVLKVKVADGIHKPGELIDKILHGNVGIYEHEDAKTNEVKEEKEGFGRQIYKHLMNGVSHMLPFVIGGGILIALAFLFDTYDAANPGNFGMGNDLSAFLKTVGGIAFGFMLPILAGYIAMSIADRPGLAVGFIGGMIASNGMTFTSQDGISAGFLGALLAGFVGGYIVVLIKKLCSKFPDSLEGIKPVLIYPLFGILLIGIFMCAINPFMAAINTGLTDGLNAMGGTSKILLGCVVAGMMAIDMGGPFNKAAYVFGTASLTTGNYDIMAAVMIGGMIPPIAIALSTTFFKNKWTANERKSGVVNYIMGLCFISEGAIPFAAADPIRVIPSCIIGSAVAGGLSMAFNCTLMAPHGGIFVTPVIGNWLMYLVALVAGSLIATIILSFLKKKVAE